LSAGRGFARLVWKRKLAMKKNKKDKAISIKITETDREYLKTQGVRPSDLFNRALEMLRKLGGKK